MRKEFLTLSLILSIFLVGFVSAECSDSVNTFLTFEDYASNNSISIIKGDLVELSILAISHNGELWHESLRIESKALIYEEYSSGNFTLAGYMYNKNYVLETENLDEGVNTLIFTAETRNDCSRESSSLILNVLPRINDENETDTTSPTLEIIYPVNNQTYNNYVTELSFNVTDENLKYCTYKLNQNSNITISNPVNGVNNVNTINSTNGTNIWSVTCYDDSNNSNTKTVTFLVNITSEDDENETDTTSSTLEIIYPVNNQTYNNYVTELSFNVTDENLKYCTYKLNQNSNITISNPVNGVNNVNTINSTNGTNIWSVTCYDDSNNSNTKTVTFLVNITSEDDENETDTTSSTLEIIYPVNNQTYNNYVTELSFNVTDENLKYCTYKLNQNSNITISNPVNGVNNVNTINSTNGTNIWSVTCYDDSNNSNTKTVTFLVNITSEDDDEDDDDEKKKSKGCSSCNSIDKSIFFDEDPVKNKIQKIYEDETPQIIKLNANNQQSFWQKIVSWFINLFK